MTFWIPWAIDLVVAGIAVYFFLVGLGDGTVSSFNIGLWSLILGGLAAVVGGSLALRAASHEKLAKALVMVLAIPSVLVGLFFAALVIVPVRWN